MIILYNSFIHYSINRLTQQGIQCQEIEDLIVNEKTSSDQRRKEFENQIINSFATNIMNDYDIQEYLNRFTEFVLFNLTDHVTSEVET